MSDIITYYVRLKDLMPKVTTVGLLYIGKLLR